MSVLPRIPTPRPGPRLGRRLAAGMVAGLSGSLLLSGCSLDVYQLPLPGGPDVGDDPITVQVQFRDVMDLVPQSTVKVNDVDVGQVSQVETQGYHALVTLELANDVDLPDNAQAKIRQTSLLGEKFVSLESPARPSPARLGDDDLIPLSRSGRNPEVEEALGALSLVLNGGGVGQLKTISREVSTALDGREGAAKSVLGRLDVLMRQLDDNKGDIITALESVNRLSKSVNRQRESIDLALEELPPALRSINRQRDDLVRMLRALNDLSDVGVRVIDASSASVRQTLRQLQPILGRLADASNDLPYAFSTLLTYPFVDESIGRNPQDARNLHMGDYANLDMKLDLDLSTLPLPTCLPSGLPTDGLPSLPVPTCLPSELPNPRPRNLPTPSIDPNCLRKPFKCLPGGPRGGNGGGLPDLPDLPGGLNRAPYDTGKAAGQAGGRVRHDVTLRQITRTYDEDLAMLFVPGLAQGADR